MLNYIWAALIVFSFGFAIWSDLSDASADRFRNGDPVTVSVTPGVEGAELNQAIAAGEVPVTLSITGGSLAEHYAAIAEEAVAQQSVALAKQRAKLEQIADETGEANDPASLPNPDAVTAFEDVSLPAKLLVGEDGAEVRFADDAELPLPWAEMDSFLREHADAKFFGATLPDLAEVVPSVAPDASNTERFVAWLSLDSWSLTFDPVRLRKLKQIEAAAFWWAEWSISFAIGLVGALCLWLGLVKIAEDAGLVLALVKVVRPLLGMIFPEVPKDHPAMGMIAMNLSANVLGLGNAATPLGIKAMEELQQLNTTDDTATNSMCMFLAVNTASVQLVPPATLVAIMGVSTGALWLPILIVTGLSLLIAISTAKALSLAPVYARTDPMKNNADRQTPADNAEGGDA